MSLPRAVLIGDLNMLRSFTDTKIPTLLVTDQPEAMFSNQIKEWRILEGEEDILSVLWAIGNKPQDSTELPVLFYGDDNTLMAVSENRDYLEQYFHFLMPPHETVEACTDKQKFGVLAEKHYLPVPQQISSESQENYFDLDFPVVVKPNNHVGWHTSGATEHLGGKPGKVLIAHNKQELNVAIKNAKKHSSEFIIQEYVHGGEENIYSFHAYVDKDHQIQGSYVGKKVRTYPMTAGESSYLELVDDEEVENLGKWVLRELDIVGPVKIDIKKDAITGKLYVFELNLRFNLWNHLGTAAGVNLPQIAYYDQLDVPYVKPTKHKTNIRWISFDADFRSFLTGYRKSGMSWFKYIRSLTSWKVYNIFSWKDPKPFFKHIQWKLSRKAKKAIV